jgi:hypothetical protein
MKYNGELKCIDTQEKAYLLGQIYGDGYNGYSSSCKTMLASNNGDIKVYQKLHELFPFFKLTTYSSHPNMIYLVNNEKSLYLDLKALGMISNKTRLDKTGEFHFPELREDLIPHFIRGYFDADGSFWYPTRKRSRNNLRTEFGCATKNFLLRIKDILDKNGMNFSYSERAKKDSSGNNHISYILLSSNRELSKKFADFIYKDATVYLEYKYELSHKPKDIITAYDIFGQCPKCGSSKIIKNGTRGGKYRLRCRNCGVNFTKPMPTQ